MSAADAYEPAPPAGAHGGRPTGGDVPPAAEATFRTSWRAVFPSLGGGLLLAVLVLGAALWAGGEPIDGELLAFLGAVILLFAVGMLAWEALRYRLLGVAEVRVAPETVEVVGHGGVVRRVLRRKLEDARLESVGSNRRWVLRTRTDRDVVRDVGFMMDDWFDLSSALTAWKVEDAHGPLPGVERRQQDAVVFHVRRPWLPLLLMAAVALGCFSPLVLGWADYQDGTWAEDALITVLFPLVGVGLVAFVAIHVRRAVRRVTFGPDAVTFDRLIGGNRTVPYGDVLDADGGHVETQAGTFTVLGHNEDVFGRLLYERLAEGQLSGRRWVESALWFQPRVLITWLGGAFLVVGVSVWLAAPGRGEAAGILTLAAYVLVLWVLVKAWARRLLRDAD